MDRRGATHCKSLRDLEDPDVVRRARECDIRGNQKTRAPLVDTTRESHPTDVSGAELGDIGCATGGVGVSGFHVAHGRRQVGGGRRRVIGRVDLARDLGRGCEHIGGIHGQGETRDEACGGGADPDIPNDIRLGNGRDRGLRENRKVTRNTKIHRLRVGGRSDNRRPRAWNVSIGRYGEKKKGSSHERKAEFQHWTTPNSDVPDGSNEAAGCVRRETAPCESWVQDMTVSPNRRVAAMGCSPHSWLFARERCSATRVLVRVSSPIRQRSFSTRSVDFNPHHFTSYIISICMT